VEVRQGFVQLDVPFKEDFIGDFLQGRWHGGVLASIVTEVFQ